MQNEETQTVVQVCKDPECKSKGIPRSINDFQIHGPSGKPMGVCKECMVRKITGKERTKKKRKDAQVNPKDKVRIQPKVGDKKNQVLVDFSEYPEVLEKLKVIARNEVRTVEGQIIFFCSGIELEEQEC